MSINFMRNSGSWLGFIVPVTLVVVLSAGCGNDGGASDNAGAVQSSGGEQAATGSLRLGYFGNVTHAPAVIGEERDLFAGSLGDGVEIEYSYFNAGTEAIEALFAGAIDATFIGPNPAINGFAESDGEALRIIAGTTSGGASLVVRDGIGSAGELKGTTLATPSLGNTQDVALRAWLAEKGYRTDKTGAGDVAVVPQANADTLSAFMDGTIDGAWVPEPWATRLVTEGKGHVLLDERDLWPDGAFVTTHLIVATDYLEENPLIVEGLLDGLLDALDFATDKPEEAQAVTNAGIKRITTKALPEATIGAAWDKMTFTADPIASSLRKSKDDAVAVGLLEEVDLAGIYDLTILNRLLAERGDNEVAGR